MYDILWAFIDGSDVELLKLTELVQRSHWQRGPLISRKTRTNIFLCPGYVIQYRLHPHPQQWYFLARIPTEIQGSCRSHERQGWSLSMVSWFLSIFSEPIIVAFESSPQEGISKSKCFFLAGSVTVSCRHRTPYTPKLEQACRAIGWSLIQSILSSS